MLSNDLLPGAKAAAEYSGLSDRAIYHLVEQGKLPVVRLGSRLYFRKSEIDKVFTPGVAEG